MKTLAIALALAAGAATVGACKHETTTPTTTPIIDPTPTPAGLTGSPFTLVEMKLYLGEDLGLQIHADGRVEENRADPGKPAEWAVMAKISAAGQLLTADGSEAGAMQPDGSFKFAKGDVAPFKFDGATLVAGDRKVSIDAAGVIQGGNDMGVKLRVEGLTDDGSRRAALFALALALMGNGGADQPATAPAAPAAP
ncbi:MAG: hypothetical protein NT062_35325 [Proteobacteria bacterium]|nr:hypothetical protein [Pseudomonadota bacterium]